MALTQVQPGMLGTPQPYNFKNRIINGAMVIDQRNAGASVTPTNGQYLVDRYFAALTQASKYSAQQNAGAVTPPTGFVNYLGATSLSAYSVVAGDIFSFIQRIEANNVSDLSYGTASASPLTLSFWVRSSLTGTFGGSLLNSSANKSYVFSYTISAANTWEQKSVTITGDTAAALATGNNAAFGLYFSLGMGSTYSTTAGSWVSGSYFAPTGATSVVGTNGATFYITGVQLEQGVSATSFDVRSIGTELGLCQRYFEKSYSAADAPGTVNKASVATHLTSVTSGYLYGACSYKVQKRIKPSVTIYSYSGTADFGSDGNGTNLAASALAVANDTNFSGTNGFVMQNNSGGTLTPAGNNVMFNWVASAEL